jgi:DNA gyrase/topoisomerase IV subunit A
MFSDEGCFWQSLLLSKVLRMQQDLEDKKNEATIADLEKKIKDYEAILEKKKTSYSRLWKVHWQKPRLKLLN